MNKREKEYLLYYLEQLALKLRNNITEMQQGLNHIAEISKNISQEIPTPQKVTCLCTWLRSILQVSELLLSLTIG
jgi:hypothetical protein